MLHRGFVGVREIVHDRSIQANKITHDTIHAVESYSLERRCCAQYTLYGISGAGRSRSEKLDNCDMSIYCSSANGHIYCEAETYRRLENNEQVGRVVCVHSFTGSA